MSSLRALRVVLRNPWGIGMISFLLTTIAVGGFGLAGAWLLRKPSPERFQSSFFEFDLPVGWVCKREGTEHVCSHGAPPFASILILTMKYRGENDTAAAYRQHLSNPKARNAKSGHQLNSTVIEVRQQHLAGHSWIVARHLNSEIENYYTDYYASLTSHIAVLVTFSAHKERHRDFQSDFDTMINSLKIYQSGVVH
jgi:hypothetical protein